MAWQWLGALLAITAFFVLGAMLLWLAGRLALWPPFALGMALFAACELGAWLVAIVVCKLLRWNIYDHANAYIVLNLLACGVPMVGWSVYAVGLINPVGVGAWTVVLLYVTGGLSAVVSGMVASSIFNGHLYRTAALFLGLPFFMLYAAWAGFMGAVSPT